MASGSGGAITLEREAIGFPTALATAVGLIIAGTVLLSAQTGFGFAGSVFAWAILIAYILVMAQSASFAEAAAVLPTAGSVYDYLASGMGRFIGITGTLAAYLIVHVFAGTAEAAIAGLFAGVNFPFLEDLRAENSWIIGVGLMVILAIVNALGIRLYGGVEIAMTAAMWVTLVIFGLAGVLQTPAADISGFFGESVVGTDLETILSFVGLGMFLFVGMEYVTPLASEVRNPNRTIPWALYVGVTMVAVAMFLYGSAVARQVPNVDLGDEVFILTTPLAIPALAEELFGTFGRYWLGIAVLLASAATLNTLLASIPRIFYGMAKDGTLPSFFGYLHPRYREPWVGVGVVAAIAIVGAIWLQGNVDQILINILAAVLAWILSYVLVNIAVVALRIRRPDIERGYKTPLYPLPQVLATVGFAIAFWYIAPPGFERGDIYARFGIMLGVCAAYALIWTYAVQKKNPWKPVDPETFLVEEGIAEVPAGA